MPVKRIRPMVGGLIAIALLLGTGSWYLFGSGNSSLDEPIETNLPALDIPDPESPETSTPGFFDDFDDGLDPVWVIHYGDPFVASGQLTSNVGAGIAAGDTTWRNYQIEFDVDMTQAGCLFADSSNSVGVRVMDFDHAYWFVFTHCYSAWSFFPGGMYQGAENLFPDTRIDALKTTRHITIKVEDSKLSAYEEGKLLSSIEDASFETGAIFLQLEAETLYDNFRVILLP